MKYVLIIKMEVLKDVDYVINKMLWLKERIVKEEGSLYFDLLMSNKEDNRIEIYEVWETKEKWEQHSSSPHMSEFHELMNKEYIKISVKEYTVIEGEK